MCILYQTPTPPVTTPPQGNAIDKTLTKPWSFTRTGITTDRATLQNALIMVVSTLLYATVQIPTLRGLSHDPPAALAGSVICIVMLVVYSAYQVCWNFVGALYTLVTHNAVSILVVHSALSTLATHNALSYQ